MGASIPGRTLGRYELVKPLATGGMAEVLLARARGIEGFERYVVIKQILAERARDDAMVRMFLDEARLAASLHHANIVQVHDIGQERGDYFIAMEYIHGEDLHAMLRTLAAARHRPPLEHVVTVISSVASALHYAHEHLGPDRAPLGLVHRDVSLSNILVGYDGNVKVVDFGIAKAAQRSTRTLPGILKGKISYMSPEQCLGADVDRRSDIFSLGIVLFELACVRRLFKASSDFLTMSKIVSGNVPRPALLRPDLPPALEAVILKALATSPAERFQTADEMRVALDHAAMQLGLRSSTTALADYMIELFGKRPEPWLVGDAAASVAEGDFEGSGDGVVPSAVIEELPPAVVQPGSPFERAARNPTLRVEPGRLPVVTPPAMPLMMAPPAEKPATGSGTPMGWAPVPTLAPSRRRWWIAAGIAVPVIAAMLMISMRTPELGASVRGGLDQPPVTPAAPVVREPAANAAVPAGSPPAAAPTGPTASTEPVAPEPARSAPASADPTSRSHGKPAGSSRTKPASRAGSSVAAVPRPAKPDAATDKPASATADKADKPQTWNPDALFLKAPQ